MDGLQILGLGRALPAQVVSNDDLAQVVDTSDAWIASRTGIRTRHFAHSAQGETNGFLAAAAGREALAHAGVAADEIAVCLVATFTPDALMPSVACGVAGSLGLAENVLCFDVNAACSGFLYALETARRLLAATPHRCALVIGSEVISRVLDMADRSTCVLFGDGAGAAVVRLSDAHPFVFAAGCIPNAQVLQCGLPTRENAAEKADAPYLQMDGNAVFRFAVEIVPHCLDTVLKAAKLTLADIDTIVCHQANRRILEAAARRMHTDSARFFMNLDRFGNTSAASIPLALYEVYTPEKRGKHIACAGFGAGLTWGGAVLSL